MAMAADPYPVGLLHLQEIEDIGFDPILLPPSSIATANVSFARPSSRLFA